LAPHWVGRTGIAFSSDRAGTLQPKKLGARSHLVKQMTLFARANFLGKISYQIYRKAIEAQFPAIRENNREIPSSGAPDHRQLCCWALSKDLNIAVRIHVAFEFAQTHSLSIERASRLILE
jgi:hypothetical protein